MGHKFILCILFAHLLVQAIAKSSSSEEENAKTSSKETKLDKIKMKNVQKMFGDLAEKLNETASEAMAKFKSRTRRDKGHKKGNGHFFGKRQCCEFPDYLANKQFAKSCHKEFVEKNMTRGDDKEENQKVSKCFMECVSKKRGWANADGTINKEAVTTAMAAANKSSEWEALVTKGQEKCFAELDAAQSEATDGCRGDSQQFLYCIFEHHFLNCPATSWRESDKCRAAEALISAVAAKRGNAGVEVTTAKE